jgi:hypothetical protein
LSPHDQGMAYPRELFKDSRQSDRVREAPECRWRRANQGGEADLSRLVGDTTIKIVFAQILPNQVRRSW